MMLTALILGFAGSLHCVGMCSPLAIAVTSMSRLFFLNKVLYNGGRILTYGILGSIISTAGTLLSLSEIQNLFSVLIGALLLILGITQIQNFKIPVITTLLHRLIIFLKVQYAYFFKKRNGVSVFLLGLINGILPCGLTAIALAYCLTLEGAVDGFNFMVLFGIGTLPAMLGLTSVIVMLIRRFKMNVQKINTGLMMLSGVVLIARVFFMATLEAHQTGQPVLDIVLCR